MKTNNSENKTPSAWDNIVKTLTIFVSKKWKIVVLIIVIVGTFAYLLTSTIYYNNKKTGKEFKMEGGLKGLVK